MTSLDLVQPTIAELVSAGANLQVIHVSVSDLADSYPLLSTTNICFCKQPYIGEECVYGKWEDDGENFEPDAEIDTFPNAISKAKFKWSNKGPQKSSSLKQDFPLWNIVFQLANALVTDPDWLPSGTGS